jgi:hypothetical protein
VMMFRGSRDTDRAPAITSSIFLLLEDRILGDHCLESDCTHDRPVLISPCPFEFFSFSFLTTCRFLVEEGPFSAARGSRCPSGRVPSLGAVEEFLVVLQTPGYGLHLH